MVVVAAVGVAVDTAVAVGDAFRKTMTADDLELVVVPDGLIPCSRSPGEEPGERAVD